VRFSCLPEWTLLPPSQGNCLPSRAPLGRGVRLILAGRRVIVGPCRDDFLPVARAVSSGDCAGSTEADPARPGPVRFNADFATFLQQVFFSDGAALRHLAVTGAIPVIQSTQARKRGTGIQRLCGCPSS
jgi:hypothetical protein